MRRFALPLIVLVVGLVGTLAAAILLARAEEGRQQARFDGLTIGAVSAIESRMLAQLTLLRGAAGFFNASDNVTPEDFRAYVARLRLERNYPGVLGIGYSVYARHRRELDELVANSTGGRAPRFTPYPEGERSDYSAIVYLEPMNRRNQQALGFDMMSEPTRRRAMEEARRSEAARMSGRVRLVQEIDPFKQPGFLIYAPLFRQESPEALHGWIYSPLRAHDLFNAIFAEHELSEIVVEVFDESAIESNILYRSENPPQGSSFVQERRLEIAGRPWVVRVASSPKFDAGSPLLLSAIVGVAGALISLLVASIIWLQARAGERTEQQVLLRTAELRKSNQRLIAEVEARRLAEAQVAQMQKIEAVGQLTGGIAHDFNNMLTVVIGSLDMAERRIEDRERVKHALANAKEGAVKAVDLTQQLLAFGRRQTLAPKVIDPNMLLSGMSELLRRSLGEAVLMETILAVGIWRIHADAAQLESAILNIAINARDAMPDGGALTIETANCHIEEASARQHEEVEPGEYVLLEFRDTGHGMPADVVAKALEPFFTTKEVGRGTGLGLSQVYGFVKQSAGHLGIHSEKGKGTTVKIYLPRHRGGGEVMPSAKKEPAILPHGNADEVILVVEDEDQLREMSVETLLELGYTVLSAPDGARALDLMERRPRIDLPFTDIVMPGMNGQQLADAARTGRPDLKLLFTTGYTRDVIVHHGRFDDDVSLIQKPFTASQLARKVREELDR